MHTKTVQQYAEWQWANTIWKHNVLSCSKSQSSRMEQKQPQLKMWQLEPNTSKIMKLKLATTPIDLNLFVALKDLSNTIQYSSSLGIVMSIGFFLNSSF